MTLRQILLALRARLSVFVVVLLATVITATTASLLIPKTYKATAAVLVDSKDEQSLAAAQPGITFTQPAERQGYLQTQIDIVASRLVADKVIRELDLASNPKLQADFAKDTGGEGTIEDWLAERLLRNVKVSTTQSNVIQIAYSANDPRIAARTANAFAKGYLDTMVELRTAPTRKAAEWFNEQLQGLRTKLETAQAKLTEFLQQQDIAATDDKYDLETARLGALLDQALRAREQTAMLGGGRAGERDGVAERAPELNASPVVQQLRGELALGEAKLRELATQYGPNYPAYQRQQSINQSLRERINAESRRVVSAADTSVRQSRARETALTNALAAQRAKLIAQRGSRDQAAVLRRNVESAERAYDLGLQRAAIAEVEGRARQTNLALLAAAVPPRDPMSPRLKLNIGLSALIGTLLGLALVTLLEMADRRVRTREDLILAADAPLLGVLNAWQPAQTPLLANAGTVRPLLARP
jgi:protein tyrosine kinase modulator